MFFSELIFDNFYLLKVTTKRKRYEEMSAHNDLAGQVDGSSLRPDGLRLAWPVRLQPDPFGSMGKRKLGSTVFGAALLIAAKTKTAQPFLNKEDAGLIFLKSCEPTLSANWTLPDGYSEPMEIARENNDRGYEPENCYWVTYDEQNRNYSRNPAIQLVGRTALISGFAAEQSMSKSAYYRANLDGRI